MPRKLRKITGVFGPTGAGRLPGDQRLERAQRHRFQANAANGEVAFSCDSITIVR